ncbi:unnamed protein product [Adineta steineri]|uniref:Uncharacterized protein n=1 Tax=Adineta steineri TaxID=433720 RepID=A0A815YHR3_9BILA|nr:unnamed protein product [Adineta steineri]CAF1570226.1 unnamed protein product [Adineta steineri]
MMQIGSSTVTVSNITPVKFNELYSKYNETLSCPCSTTSISYKNFVSNTIKIHPVCSSRFVSQEWIHALYLSNASRYGVSDFRTTASSQFEILSSFCSLAQDIVNHTENDVSSNEFVTIYLLPDTQVEHELSFILHEIKQINSTSISCICATNPDCQTEAVIYGNNPSVISYDDTNVIYKIPGFIRGCLNSDLLLQSTLQCLYPELNSDCFARLLIYTSLFNPTFESNRSALDLHALVYDPTRNRFPPNTLISIIFKEMMLEQWNSSWSYERFYESCAPKYCTYHQKIRSKTIVDILITLLSTIGGLAVSLRLITPHFVKFISKLWAMIRKRKQKQQEQQEH